MTRNVEIILNPKPSDKRTKKQINRKKVKAKKNSQETNQTQLLLFRRKSWKSRIV